MGSPAARASTLSVKPLLCHGLPSTVPPGKFGEGRKDNCQAPPMGCAGGSTEGSWGQGFFLPLGGATSSRGDRMSGFWEADQPVCPGSHKERCVVFKAGTKHFSQAPYPRCLEQARVPKTFAKSPFLFN